MQQRVELDGLVSPRKNPHKSVTFSLRKSNSGIALTASNESLDDQTIQTSSHSDFADLLSPTLSSSYRESNIIRNWKQRASNFQSKEGIVQYYQQLASSDSENLVILGQNENDNSEPIQKIQIVKKDLEVEDFTDLGVSIKALRSRSTSSPSPVLVVQPTPVTRSKSNSPEEMGHITQSIAIPQRKNSRSSSPSGSPTSTPPSMKTLFNTISSRGHKRSKSNNTADSLLEFALVSDQSTASKQPRLLSALELRQIYRSKQPRTAISGFRDEKKFQTTIPDGLLSSLIDQCVSWQGVVVPSKTQDSRRALKFLIRRGVPDSYRQMVWRSVSGATEFSSQNASFYSETLERVFGHRIPEHILNYPTFGGRLRLSDYYLNAEGLAAVKRILCVVGMENPGMNYLPVLPDVVCLLLHYMNEADCYTMVHCMLKAELENRPQFMEECGLLQEIGTKRYMTATSRAVELFGFTFDDFIKKHAPKLAQLMRTLSFNRHLFAEKFFNGLFINFFPFQTVLRIFDAFLSEGSKVLYRVGIAFLKRLQTIPDVMQCETAQELEKVVEYVAMQTFDSDALMKKAFSLRLKRSQVQELHCKNKNLLNNHHSEFSNDIYYRPKITTPSKVIQDEQFEIIWSWLPKRYCIKDPILLYDTDTKGYSLRNLLSSVSSESPTLLIIKSADGKGVFGAFISHEWVKHSKFYGDRQCFLWRMLPEPQRYGWEEGCLDLFMLIETSYVHIGGGNGCGIRFDDEINRGVTEPCDTFKNPPLTVDGSTDFVVAALEIYGFK